MSVGFHEVQEVLENYKSAVYEKDVERYVSSYASDLHIYDCWNDWECVGIAQWRKFTKEWFHGLDEEGALVKVDFDEVVIEENSNLAFVRCNVTFAAYNESGEKLRQMTERFTFVLRKENESWNIIHQHSSLPISMETGKGIFNRK
ncbi:YybH family protein [Tumebacillus permanentifrigoris]|uniref:SnoaL-like protein n=1 Tax=Tumebacillus permanentifrigoris TaxID=378543 RepID=A0A316D670_9BACL|nr:nuclear transport factor 2 family protein [Tumebacillus permanentifrigoris]PWK09604.1 SnoaL-like protein [Tumebacillus permanentifrigoris]